MIGIYSVYALHGKRPVSNFIVFAICKSKPTGFIAVCNGKIWLASSSYKAYTLFYNNKGQQMRDVGDSRMVMMNRRHKAACRIAIRPVAKGLGLTAHAALEQLP
jgi:hypothetical protein